MKLTQNSNKSSLSLTTITGIVILGITLLVIFLSTEVLSQTSSDVTNNAQCLNLLSNLDKYSSLADSSRVKSLFDKSCAPLNATVENKKRLISELKKCNSKAQRLIEQDSFLSKNPNICIPCSQLSSQKDFTIYTNELENELKKDKFSKIRQKKLNIKSRNEKNILLFRIEDEKIDFIIEEEIEIGYCNNVLNS